MIFISLNFNFRTPLFFCGLLFVKMSFLRKYSYSQMVSIRSFYKIKFKQRHYILVTKATKLSQPGQNLDRDGFSTVRCAILWTFTWKKPTENGIGKIGYVSFCRETQIMKNIDIYRINSALYKRRPKQCFLFDLFAYTSHIACFLLEEQKRKYFNCLVMPLMALLMTSSVISWSHQWYPYRYNKIAL